MSTYRKLVEAFDTISESLRRGGAALSINDNIQMLTREGTQQIEVPSSKITVR
jgi:hypothetical protein